MLEIGVDIGSVRRAGGFAWASADGRLHGSDDPSVLAGVLADSLNAGERVAVAFEAPVAVPVPAVSGDGWRDLARARTGEGNRSWSAGAGAGALATGIVQIAWIFRYLADHCGANVRITTQIDRFLADRADIFVAEAMVTADGKPESVAGLQDHADAAAAAQRLSDLLHEVGAGGPAPTDVICAPHRSLNLIAAAALHAGLSIEIDELQMDVLVAKVLPVDSRRFEISELGHPFGETP